MTPETAPRLIRERNTHKKYPKKKNENPHKKQRKNTKRRVGEKPARSGTATHSTHSSRTDRFRETKHHEPPRTTPSNHTHYAANRGRRTLTRSEPMRRSRCGGGGEWLQQQPHCTTHHRNEQPKKKNLNQSSGRTHGEFHALTPLITHTQTHKHARDDAATQTTQPNRTTRTRSNRSYSTGGEARERTLTGASRSGDLARAEAEEEEEKRNEEDDARVRLSCLVSIGISARAFLAMRGGEMGKARVGVLGPGAAASGAVGSGIGRWGWIHVWDNALVEAERDGWGWGQARRGEPDSFPRPREEEKGIYWESGSRVHDVG